MLMMGVTIMNSVSGLISELGRNSQKDVGREDQEKFICTFDTMDFERVDMTTMVIIGNKSTYIHGDLMITPRGYTV